MAAFASLVSVALATVVAAGTARADSPPRVLVLPLPATASVDADTARAFDARLLVALDDSRRVVTVTASDDPECTTMTCLAALGVASDAAFVLSLTAVDEDGGVTLFGTLVDASSAAAARRVELAVTAATLARLGPAGLVPQIVDAPAGRVVVGMTRPKGAARPAATAIADRLAAYGTFDVVSLDGSDRAALTHRAALSIDQLTVGQSRRLLCRWHDGTLVGTFAITELATGKVVFTRTVDLAVSRRSHFWTAAEVTELLLDRAVEDWLAAFHARGVRKLVPSKR